MCECNGGFGAAAHVVIHLIFESYGHKFTFNILLKKLKADILCSLLIHVNVGVKTYVNAEWGFFRGLIWISVNWDRPNRFELHKTRTKLFAAKLKDIWPKKKAKLKYKSLCWICWTTLQARGKPLGAGFVVLTLIVPIPTLIGVGLLLFPTATNYLGRIWAFWVFYFWAFYWAEFNCN